MIAEASPQTGLMMESLMASVAQSDQEAKKRIRDFLEHKAAKVKPAHMSGEANMAETEGARTASAAADLFRRSRSDVDRRTTAHLSAPDRRSATIPCDHGSSASLGAGDARSCLHGRARRQRWLARAQLCASS